MREVICIASADHWGTGHDRNSGRLKRSCQHILIQRNWVSKLLLSSHMPMLLVFDMTLWLLVCSMGEARCRTGNFCQEVEIFRRVIWEHILFLAGLLYTLQAWPCVIQGQGACYLAWQWYLDWARYSRTQGKLLSHSPAKFWGEQKLYYSMTIACTKTSSLVSKSKVSLKGKAFHVVLAKLLDKKMTGLKGS